MQGEKLRSWFEAGINLRTLEINLWNLMEVIAIRQPVARKRPPPCRWRWRLRRPGCVSSALSKLDPLL